MRTLSKAESGVIVAMALVFSISSCTKKHSPQHVNTESSASFALVPMRALFVPPAAPLYDDDARKAENAIRVSYGIVSCTSSAKSGELTALVNLGRRSVSAIQRKGRDIIYSPDGKAGYKSNCQLAGPHLMSIGSFVGIFGKQPTTQQEFETQQTVWLSLRRIGTATDLAYAPALSQFLSENLGAYPTTNKRRYVGRIQAARQLV